MKYYLVKTLEMSRMILVQRRATLFVLISALYRENMDHTVSVSFFMKDDKGGELYWIRNVINSFVIGIVKDTDFRKKVKEELTS